MHDEQGPPDETGLAVSALFFYVILTVIACVGLAFGGFDVTTTIFGDGANVIRDTAAGAASGLVVVGLTRVSLRFEAVRELNRELSGLLGTPSTKTITVLAISSAIGEEFLFRGLLQPLLGLLVTTLLFAFLHGGYKPKYRTWAVFAFGVGLLLGALTLWTNNLLAAILCHFTVNYFNLHTVVHHEDPEE